MNENEKKDLQRRLTDFLAKVEAQQAHRRAMKKEAAAEAEKAQRN